MQAIYFKILQRRLKFRNPNHLVQIPDGIGFDAKEFAKAQAYLDQLSMQGIQYTHPGHSFYPEAFLKMKEPPLFLEFRGNPVWLKRQFISVIGSREIFPLTRNWMSRHIPSFLESSGLALVSGGARGVDQLAHLLALKSNVPTVFVLPSGLNQIYPENLRDFQREEFSANSCFLSEFELGQKIHKSHFYFRNRLIAALGDFTLVVQATLKSGSLLTVHHCLENGRPVVVTPAHPELVGFDGNLKLLREGAFLVANEQDLLDFWIAEFQHK